jgi:hypothetical protein
LRDNAVNQAPFSEYVKKNSAAKIAPPFFRPA